MLFFDYCLCGWHVRSTLRIPGLPPWNGDVSTDADIWIDQGSVPEHLDDALNPNRYLAVGADGTVLLHLVDVVRFLIRGGRHITVDLRHPSAEAFWHTFLLGSVLSYLCHQRGLFPWHSACLRVAGRTIAIGGHSGSGKSTIALTLLQRGHQLISDDLAILEDAGSHTQVLPAYPRLNLWRDTAAAAGVEIDGLPTIRPGIEKYSAAADISFDPEPSRLHAAIVLREADRLELERVPVAAAIPLIENYIPRRQVAELLGRRPGLFAQAAVIAMRVPVYKLYRPKRFDMLAATAATLESVCEE